MNFQEKERLHLPCSERFARTRTITASRAAKGLLT